MSQSQTNLKSIAAIVTTVITTTKEGLPLMKRRADGSEAPYALVGIKFTDGSLKGKSTWAQRSLLNRDGVIKEPVAVGDEVFGTLTGIVNGKPFFEVTTSTNATDADLLAAFGEIAQPVAKAADVEVKLAQ
jgi:hypothetical protein